jgi:PTH2 family peptidyl-tRNA hydrolase
MPAGKAASQAGHAFLGSFLSAPTDVSHRYQADGVGTKIVLMAPGEPDLRAAYDQARERGLPCVLVADKGHVMPPAFTGAPIVTALGIGPALRRQVRDITARFPLM